MRPLLRGVAEPLGPLDEAPSLRASRRLRMSEMLGRALAPELLAVGGVVVFDGLRKIDPDRSDELSLGLLNEGPDRSPAVDGALGRLVPLLDVPRIRRNRSKSGRPAEGLADDPEPLDPRSMMLGRAARDGNDGRPIDGEVREVDGEDGRPMIEGVDRDVDGEDEREGRVIRGRLDGVDGWLDLPIPGLEIDGLLDGPEMLGRELGNDGGRNRIVEPWEELDGRENVGVEGRLRLKLGVLGRLMLGRLRLMLGVLGRLMLGRLRLMLGVLGRLRLMLGRLRLTLGALGRLRLMLGRLDAPRRRLLVSGRLGGAAVASVAPANSNADARIVGTNRLRGGRWIAAMIRISQ